VGKLKSWTVAVSPQLQFVTFIVMPEALAQGSQLASHSFNGKKLAPTDCQQVERQLTLFQAFAKFF